MKGPVTGHCVYAKHEYQMAATPRRLEILMPDSWMDRRHEHMSVAKPFFKDRRSRMLDDAASNLKALAEPLHERSV